ncbi:MAG: hypothetical protein HYV63_20700 [Candidatus Schekmanbacteria bacterium]|nr:hypothetical protein [Candidatus Schekmanbacteria bacterium]
MARTQELPFSALRIVSKLLLMGSLAATAVGCVEYRSGPSQVGVVVRKIAIGVKPMDVLPSNQFGWYVPYVTQFFTLTRVTRRACMAEDIVACGAAKTDESGISLYPPLSLKTKDGNTVSLDLLIEYSIDDSTEAVAFILENVGRSDREIEEIVLKAVLRSIPRDFFSQMATEDLKGERAPDTADDGGAELQRRPVYRRADEAKEALAKELQERYHIKLEKYIYKDHHYTDTYQELVVEEKQLVEQLGKFEEHINVQRETNKVLLAQARAEAARKHGDADAEFSKIVTGAEAFLAQQKLLAEAVEREGDAESEAARLHNESLAGDGGRRIVQMNVARKLMGKRVLLMPIGGGGMDLRTTDVNKLLEMYGLTSLARPSADAEPGKAASPPAAATPGGKATDAAPSAAAQGR